MDTSWKNSLVGRILAVDLDGKTERTTLEMGTVLTEEDVKAIAKEFKQVTVYSGIIASPIKVTNDNVNAVLDYGSRMFEIGRVTLNGEDLTNADGEVMCPTYLPDVEVTSFLQLIKKQSWLRLQTIQAK